MLMIACSICTINAQDRAPSPSATTVQKVGLTDITVDYSRPSMKERTIFADDGLVPFGKMWRTDGSDKIILKWLLCEVQFNPLELGRIVNRNRNLSFFWTES